MGRAHGDLVDLWCSPRPCLVCLAGGHAAVCHLVVSAPQFGASQHAFWFGAGPGACATRHSLSHLQWPAGTHGGHGYPLPGRWHMWLDGWATACSLARTGRGDGGDGAAAAAVCAHYYQNTTDPDSGTDARTVCVVIRGSSGAGADRRRFGGDDPVGGARSHGSVCPDKTNLAGPPSGRSTSPSRRGWGARGRTINAPPPPAVGPLDFAVSKRLVRARPHDQRARAPVGMVSVVMIVTTISRAILRARVARCRGGVRKTRHPVRLMCRRHSMALRPCSVPLRRQPKEALRRPLRARTRLRFVALLPVTPLL